MTGCPSSFVGRTGRRWFSAGELSDESFQRIMVPYEADEMNSLPVSALVKSARVGDPRCCEPMARTSELGF